MFIDRDTVIAVVEGLHPVIIDLKIPGLALGYALESNAEGLVRLKSEVSMVVENIGVSTDGLAERLIPQGQGVGVLDDLLAPARKQPQGVLIKRDGLIKISRRLRQVEGAGVAPLSLRRT